MYGSTCGSNFDRRLRWSALVLFLFLYTVGAGQPPRPAAPRGDMVGWANEELTSLQSGELTVWESGSGVRLGWAAIQNALNETFSANVRVRFATAPDLVAGIELTVNGQKVAWSISDYLASMEKGVGELLGKEAK